MTHEHNIIEKQELTLKPLAIPKKPVVREATRGAQGVTNSVNKDKSNYKIPSKMEYVQHAGFWIRGLALLIDTLIVMAFLFISYLLLALFGGGFGFFLYITTGLFIIFYPTMTTGSSMQATFGKKILGLRVITTDGYNVSPAKAFCRQSVIFLSSLLGVYIIDVIVAAVRPDKMTIHDMIVGTKVIYTSSLDEYYDRLRSKQKAYQNL